MVCSTLSYPLESAGDNHLPEGRDLAKHFGCEFIETSAKHRLNVDEAFSNIVRFIRRYNKVCYHGIREDSFSFSQNTQQQQTGRPMLAGIGSGVPPKVYDDKTGVDEASGCCVGCVTL